MERNFLGVRVRERRRQKGLTQAELARRLDISASYLNLIEHNKRRIAGKLVRRIADALELEPGDLDGANEARLAEALEEIAAIPAVRDLGVERARAAEFLGRYPGWARALAALARSEQAASAQARALSDRLTHDAFLGEAVHRMLNRISAVNSAAEILHGSSDLAEADRDRFQAIVYDEARALTGVGEALAAYFDRLEEADRSLTPMDEVEALFEANGNRFPEIEAAAGELAVRITDPAPAARRAEARRLIETELAPILAATIADRPEIETANARARAEKALGRYAIDALLAPMPSFAPLAAELAYDVEALSDAAAIEAETVFRRLTALPNAQATPRFGYFQANAAGAITMLHGLPGLAAPRYAAACPLWILYRAQQSPGATLRQRAEFPTGDRFVFVARARNVGATGFGRPRHYLTDMLTMSEADAALTVYAPETDTPIEDVGPACRLCRRETCPQRVEDPLGA